MFPNGIFCGVSWINGSVVSGSAGGVQRDGVRVRADRVREELHDAGRAVAGGAAGRGGARPRARVRGRGRGRGPPLPRAGLLPRDLQRGHPRPARGGRPLARAPRERRQRRLRPRYVYVQPSATFQACTRPRVGRATGSKSVLPV